jgi:DNA helicase HerA-like ATPase
MTALNTDLFSGLRSVGSISSVSASYAKVNLSKAGMPSGTVYGGVRYGLGEVSEFVLIEGERSAVFGRITEVKLPESERLSVEDEAGVGVEVHALAFVQLLATVSLRSLRVTSGIEAYPRLGDKVYSAPHSFIAKIPELMSIKEDEKHQDPKVSLRIGHIKNAPETAISITPEKLFGRHCAVLGATGGGKSYTVSRLIEESRKHACKLILLDATGEYRDLSGDVEHFHFGEPFHKADKSKQASIPPSCFLEQDFISLFEPSGKVQGPKLRAAIRSLKLAEVQPKAANDEGIVIKVGVPHKKIARIENQHSEELENPKQPFKPENLVKQLVQECVKYSGDDAGQEDDWNFNFCLPMITRISGILKSDALAPVFQHSDNPVDKVIDEFLEGSQKVLRICMSGLLSDFNAKEVITNSIGRNMLERARKAQFQKRPLLIFLDEAHGFIGRSFGSEDFRTKLDAFEVISKEGRKYGLNLCLATQRPRDIPEGVISQMGTLLVHRLTNDKDREMVERACGEIDRSASSFLPNLQPGEVALLGVDFPIPMTIQIAMPTTKPKSDGANFQEHWDNRIDI